MGRRRTTAIISIPSTRSCLSHSLVALFAFYLGVYVGGATTEHPSSKHHDCICPQKTSLGPSFQANHNVNASSKANIWPDSMKSLFHGAARVPREEFMQQFDIGVPLDNSHSQNNEVLLLYGPGTLPVASDTTSSIPRIPSISTATEKCKIVKQVLLQQDKQSCLALVGQWESFHIHKWVRGNDSEPAVLFENVPRSHTSIEDEQSFPPHGKSVLMAKQYGQYIGLLDELYAELKPIAAEVAGSDNNAVVVMVCNKGQSVLLANFACAAKARNLDTSKILLFASDLYTHHLAQSLGLRSYHHPKLFEDTPEQAAKVYGDHVFKAMMMTKIYAVHMINLLGYDVLFQDTDMIWFKDPLVYFQTRVPSGFDIYFQDDGQHRSKYAPYSPNTGFYYMRHNKRTQFLMSHLLRMGDVVMNTGSHQETMTQLMAEHASWRGLKVKTINRNEPDFPCGFHFHERREFMNDFLAGGKVEPYVFHMSWTEGKEDKIKYLQQISEWYWNSTCGQVPDHAAADCCLAKPLFQCHYSNKPSKKPC
mmetsp:Transcript_10301/g.15808  ORF Transcript_10301/g.15808 Transcript_10301/m.15808 type:complete len:534 (+) Transcript_10301:161-1762(+)